MRKTTWVLLCVLFSLVGFVAGGVELGNSPKVNQDVVDLRGSVLFTLMPSHDSGVNTTHWWVRHGCCDCGLSHLVLIYPDGDKLRMYWWRDEKGTMRSRASKGWSQEFQNKLMNR